MRQQDTQIVSKKLQSITDIPTIPTVIAKLNDVLRTPHSNVKDVGAILNQDQALAAKTLRLVNSAYYGFSGKIDNINRAIIILGFNKVRNLALSISVIDLFKGKESSSLNFLAFWEHSIGTAVIAEQLANELESSEVEDAFVAGLLHDLGKLIIALHLKEDQAKVVEMMQADNMFSFDAEREIIGANHGKIGELIAEQWKFPENLARAMGYHHQPDRSRQHRELVFLIHTADVLAHAIGFGAENEYACPGISDEVWEQLALTPSKIDAVYERAIPAYKVVSDFFELASGT
ncbi:MAG: HDOD domain-containing protein [Planctomycetes bacterium]|nr:HDOD domain-containing protein [Planctomycetota bacterium]